MDHHRLMDILCRLKNKNYIKLVFLPLAVEKKGVRGVIFMCNTAIPGLLSGSRVAPSK